MSYVDGSELVAHQWCEGSEFELEPGVARNEAEPLVEPVCVGPRDIRRELYECASSSLRLVDRPVHEVGTEPGAAVVGPDPNSLDLTAQGAAPGETGDERHLQCPDRFVVENHDDQKLVRICVVLLESVQVGPEVTGIVASRTELVVRQHAHYRTDVLTPCPADDVVVHA